MSERVFISGMGVISAAGNDVPASLRTMKRGERRVGPITLFNAPLELPVYEVPDFSSTQLGSRTLQLAVRAVSEALMTAELDCFEGVRVGVAMGTTVACQLNDIDFYTAVREGADPLQKSESPDAVDQFLGGNLSEALAARFGLEGPRITVVNACSSGADAIGAALSWLKTGACDVAIAGGADELNRVPVAGFNSLSVASDEPCAPFDVNRKGLNLGEGAGVLVLETAAHAEKRGVKPALELCGYGSSADAYHMTAPHPEGAGLERAIRAALAQAAIGFEEVAFVNAHGTATRENDKVEGNTLHRLFGKRLTFLSTKGFTGHTLGAAGGIEAVFAGAALQAGWLPASVGFQTRDPEIPCCPIVEQTLIDGEYALSTSLAFGGENAALLLRRIR